MSADAATQQIVAAQERMLRLAERDYDLSIKVLSLEARIPERTLASYKKGTMMPMGAFHALCKVIPDELTSLMLPDGKHIGTDEPGDGDEATLAREAAGYNVEYLNVTDPHSDGGSAITPRERGNLRDRARRLSAVARKVAA